MNKPTGKDEDELSVDSYMTIKSSDDEKESSSLNLDKQALDGLPKDAVRRLKDVPLKGGGSLRFVNTANSRRARRAHEQEERRRKRREMKRNERAKRK